MADVAKFEIFQPPRCHELVGQHCSIPCGSLASWVRPGVGELPSGYFCDSHRQIDDRPIPAEFLLRRVSVVVEVSIAAASMLPGLAQHEAVERVRQAVEGAGGLFNLHTVTSTVGRYRPPADAGKGKGGRPRRQ